MGKPRIIAERAPDSMAWPRPPFCARFGLECVVYMLAKTSSARRRRVPDETAGRDRRALESGSKTLKDALNEPCATGSPTFKHLLYHRTVAGPHPYPMMVRDFQSVIARNAWCRCRK